MTISKFKLSLITAAFAFSFSSLSQAECIQAEPLCRAMHDMANTMDCIQNKLPPGLCGNSGPEQLKTAAAEARTALLAKSEFTDAQRVDINNLFDQLDSAITELIANFGDDQLKAVAIKKIIAIKKQGHLEFQD